MVNDLSICSLRTRATDGEKVIIGNMQIMCDTDTKKTNQRIYFFVMKLKILNEGILDFNKQSNSQVPTYV